MKYSKILGLAPALTALCLVACDRPINTPPDPPTKPQGTASGRADSTYTFTTTASDPDADLVCVRFDWGDGDTSDWSDTGSGLTGLSASHTWLWPGAFAVTAQAKDTDGALSAWSAPTVTSIRPLPPYPDSEIGYIEMWDEVVSDVAVTKDGDLIFYQVCDGVCPIRTSDDSVPAEIHLEDTHKLALSPGGEYLFVIGYHRTVFKATTSDFTVVDSAVGDTWPRDICVSPSVDELYMVTRQSLLAMRCSDLSVRIRTPLPYCSDRTLACSIDGNSLYILGAGVITVIDATTLLPVDSIEVPPCSDILVMPDGVHLWTYGGCGSTIVHTPTNIIVDYLPVRCGEMTVSADGGYVYASGEDNVQVVDVELGRVVGNVVFDGCECHHPIAVLPDNSRFYVAVHDIVWVFGHSGPHAY